MTWNIVTDSSCDLFPSRERDCGVQIATVPFVISVGERDFIDDEALDTGAMLDAMEAERGASHTSCPTPQEWARLFEQADCTIAITLSARLSGSMNSAVIARDIVRERHPEKKIALLDSRSAGPELVLCVREVKRLIRCGLNFREVVFRAKKYLQETQVLFALSSFDNLIKSGRMDPLTGILSKTFGIWGIGSGSEEGNIILEGRARGARRAVEALAARMRANGFRGSRAVISHCHNPALAQLLKAQILRGWPAAEVMILPTRGLCSYYAERGGLLVGYETWRDEVVEITRQRVVATHRRLPLL